MAIQITNLNRGFGSGKKRNHVLKDLNMSVNEGTIYGLLGPSGCGKTTLLKSVLGRLAPESGELKVLGESSGGEGCKVPGSAV
ncbi:MAG: ATP-binding cassette domain-containing protein, partial [Euryarchaeota archaeon]|nr:ATP-binding cassette domain-containing protein [Euryarchaeota archaeon]